MEALTHYTHEPMAITKQERAFFAALGERIASRRREQAITQAQLAEALGISQQTVLAYEVGRRRIPVSALSTLAQTLDLAIEELLGASPAASRRRGPAPKLQRHLERINALPKPKQRAVMEVLEAVLAQANR